MSQIALPFSWPADEDESDFLLSDANRKLVEHLNHWSLWPVMATLVTGPRKSGRSLLGRIFARKTGGMLVDDAERADEETLFHLWNRAQETHRPLLIVADRPLPGWEVRLPDLRSRLSATPHVAISDPDDALVRALIERLLGQRGLAAPPDVIAYVAARIERSYVGILRAIDAIDELSLERRSRLTIPLARRALGALGVID